MNNRERIAREMQEAGYLGPNSLPDELDLTMWFFVAGWGTENVRSHLYNSGIWQLNLTSGVMVSFTRNQS